MEFYHVEQSISNVEIPSRFAPATSLGGIKFHLLNIHVGTRTWAGTFEFLFFVNISINNVNNIKLITNIDVKSFYLSFDYIKPYIA